MASGIYRIQNLVNDHIYIGCASYLSVRKSGHFSALRKGSHRNRYLQRAFKKYGEASFRFSVLEHVADKNELIAREQYWLDLAVAEESHLYNLEKVATRTAFIKPRKYWLGKKRSQEDREKFVRSHLGKFGIPRKDNKTGIVGVQQLKGSSKYYATFTVNHVTKRLGSFNSLLLAYLARKGAEQNYLWSLR